MASVYTLARDKLEQVRAILSTNASFDAEADHVLDLAIRRMTELDNLVSTGLLPEPGARPHKAHISMPWLDR
jgi:hypothetical protein